MSKKEPCYAKAILASLISTVAGLLVNLLSWKAASVLSTVLLVLGVGGLATIFIHLFVQHYGGSKGR